MESKRTRRSFLIGGASAALGTIIAKGEVSTSSLREELRARLSAAGFDAERGDGAVLGIIGDPHICLGSEYPQYRTEKWEDGLIDELNGMWPLMSDVAIAGDLITYHSMSPGIPRYPIHEVWAREEFQLAKREIARFDPRFRIWCVPGNHDTTADEANAELWQEMLGIPAYRKAVLGGVPVFFMNSGNGAMFGPGQLAWFRSEAAKIPGEQEIVVVMHHPVFFAMREESSLKRLLCEMFGGRKGKVWIVGGHGHRFEDQTFRHKGTHFVQMEVTAANLFSSSDDRSPGYIALALQDGRVVARIFRSLKETGFQARSLVSGAATPAVRFQFDGVSPLAAAFEEGLYDRAGRVLSFSGVDVGSYITYLKAITFQIKPGEYSGRLSKLVLAGTIAATIRPLCSISRSGGAGSWEPLVFPENRGAGLFHIPIPEPFRDAPGFQVKIETGLTGTLQGFNLSGWALAADPKSLSAYAWWMLAVHGHLRREPATAAMAVTPGTTSANLTNFAYGLAVPGQADGTPLVPPGAISGVPRVRRSMREVLEFRFARRRAASMPGVACVVERSRDLRSWERLEEEALGVRLLDSVWEEVSVARVIAPGQREYLRVGVVEDVQLGTGFGKWKSAAFAQAGRDQDVNGNGVEDVIEYALGPESVLGGLRKSELGRKAMDFRFTRRREDSLPGVKCVVERSTDLRSWERLDEAELVVRKLDSVWEEVSVSRSILPGSGEFLRVGVFEDVALGTGFGQWKSAAFAEAAKAKDVNGNGIEDLLEYAFDLGSGSRGSRRYDPGRAGAWAGVPHYEVKRAAVTVVAFPRMRASARPGVSYTLEWSSNLKDWVPVPGWLVAERVLRSEGDWDEVEYSVIDGGLPARFFRVALSEE